MKRDCNSMRSVKWLERNELGNPNCEQYVRNLCIYEFEFDDFKIDTFELNRKALYITYEGIRYVICASRKDVGLVILEERGERSYMRLFGHEAYGDKCWHECLTKIKNGSVRKNKK